MKIRGLIDFKKMKSKISKDKSIKEDLDFYIDIPENISNVTVHGSITFHTKVSNVNYIPWDIRDSLTFEKGVSFEKLNHKIFAHSIFVNGDGLTTTKGLKFVNLHEYRDFNPVTSGQKIKLFLSDNYKDNEIEFLPAKTIEKMMSFEGTRNSTRIFLGTRNSFIKFSKCLSESVIQDYIRDCKEKDIECTLEDVINYAYFHAYNNIGESVLDWI